MELCTYIGLDIVNDMIIYSWCPHIFIYDLIYSIAFNVLIKILKGLSTSKPNTYNVFLLTKKEASNSLFVYGFQTLIRVSASMGIKIP